MHKRLDGALIIAAPFSVDPPVLSMFFFTNPMAYIGLVASREVENYGLDHPATGPGLEGFRTARQA